MATRLLEEGEPKPKPEKGTEAEKPAEKPAERPVEKPAEKHVEFKLPPEVHALPSRFEDLVKEWQSFRDAVTKTVEPLKSLIPEEKVPCPGCETPIPKSKAEEVKRRLEEKAPVKEVIRELPPKVETRVETKEVPLKHERFAEMLENLTEGKKFSPEQTEAVKKIHDYMSEKKMME